jgi:hypothetical protein
MYEPESAGNQHTGRRRCPGRAGLRRRWLAPYDEIVEACQNAWNWLIADPGRIRSIGTCDWATVNQQGFCS